jgi:hypothetical protein
MTEAADKRILIFKGPSGYSKSALLNASARYANILGVPAAYVDFKDTQFLHQTNILERLRLDLGAVLPAFAAAEEPKPWKLLGALRQLSSSALILLDTYEKITETKELIEWIETQLLAEVEQCKQLRFLIAGQKVPERANARWLDLAEEIELRKINNQQAWKEWIQQKNPHVDDKHVEGIVLGLEGVPGPVNLCQNANPHRLTPWPISSAISWNARKAPRATRRFRPLWPPNLQWRPGQSRSNRRSEKLWMWWRCCIGSMPACWNRCWSFPRRTHWSD